jgi:Trehalose utilisation
LTLDSSKKKLLLSSISFFVIALASQLGPFHFLTSDRDFRGVDPPDWVLDGAVKVFTSLEDSKSLEATAAIGATIVHAGGPSLYYPLRRIDANSGIPDPERTKLIDGIAKAKQLGMRVVLGVSPYAPIPIVRDHADWMHHATDDASIVEKAKLDLTTPENIALRSLPLNTPYGDYAIECLAEMMRDLDVDGFSFDGCYHHFINFSPFEKELYRKDTGRDIPPRIDLNDEAYRIYLLWADEKLESWYRRLGSRLREVNPESAIYTWTTNAGRYGHFLTSPRVMSARMNRLIHCPVQEWWLDEVNLGATVLPYFGAAYVRAVSGGKVGASEPYLMSRGNPYSTDSFPPHELTVRCLGAMTNGSFTPLAQMAGPEATYATLREIAIRKPWFTRLTQEPWAALLVSEQTRQFYAHGSIMERWLSHALGVYRVGMEEHLPITLITELELTPEVLSKHRVLVLPNVACLSDDQVATIRNYVNGGGGLVATCETSLCDELGKSRGDFALKDLFGTSYGGRPKESQAKRELDVNFAIAINDSYWANRGNIGAFRFSDYSESIFATDPKLKQLVPGGQATYKGPLIKPFGFEASMKPAVMFFPEGSREPFPVVATGQYGKGRVVYFAAGVDSAYFNYGFPYQRIMLGRALRWAAREHYPIEVKAPMCVQSTFWKQQNGRLIVHLWNGLNSTSDHGLQEVETPLREESIPIHGIELRTKLPPYRAVRCEPQGIDIPTRIQGDTTIYAIPPVDIHSAIVIEQ